MRDEAQERLELLSAIQDLGYESLRYSIFNEYGPGEWEVVIEFDDSKQVYNVYATMDRASYNKKLEFDNFEDAKNKFIEKLDLTIEINKLFVENGEVPEYSSPLWDKIEADIENMKCIVEQEIKKRHFESLHYVLFDETKRLPWAFHLFYKDGIFMINGRDDRSYVIGNTIEFTSFEDAKIAFLEKLEHFVKSNQFRVKIGETPDYSSPLWDEKEDYQKMRDESEVKIMQLKQELMELLLKIGETNLNQSDLFTEEKPSLFLPEGRTIYLEGDYYYIVGVERGKINSEKKFDNKEDILYYLLQSYVTRIASKNAWANANGDFDRYDTLFQEEQIRLFSIINPKYGERRRKEIDIN